MTDLTERPAPMFGLGVYNTGDPFWTGPPANVAIVGTTCWADDDDATYTTVATGFEADGTMHIDIGWAPIGGLGAIDPDTVTDVITTVRALTVSEPSIYLDLDADGAFLPQLQVGYYLTVGGGFNAYAAWETTDFLTTTTLAYSLHDAAVAVGVDPVPYVTGVSEYYAAGGIVAVQIVTGIGGSLYGVDPVAVTVYEVMVTFVYPGGETVAVTRLYPRDDGLGASSAPRRYPTPKADRAAGGYL